MALPPPPVEMPPFEEYARGLQATAYDRALDDVAEQFNDYGADRIRATRNPYREAPRGTDQ